MVFHIFFTIKEEKADKTLSIIGLENPEKLVLDFWNAINNSNKASINILSNDNVQTADVSGEKIIVIRAC